MNKDNAKDYLPLVQALAEGRVIETRMDVSSGAIQWVDMGGADFCYPSDCYRIKPEPREVWINRHISGRISCVAHDSEAEASAGIDDQFTPVRFREVLE